jgi:hypothetical protein
MTAAVVCGRPEGRGAPPGSDGICGGETDYLFSPTQAQRLTVGSPFVAAEDRQLAAGFEAPAWLSTGAPPPS